MGCDGSNHAFVRNFESCECCHLLGLQVPLRTKNYVCPMPSSQHWIPAVIWFFFFFFLTSRTISMLTGGDSSSVGCCSDTRATGTALKINPSKYTGPTPSMAAPASWAWSTTSGLSLHLFHPGQPVLANSNAALGADWSHFTQDLKQCFSHDPRRAFKPSDSGFSLDPK